MQCYDSQPSSNAIQIRWQAKISYRMHPTMLLIHKLLLAFHYNELTSFEIVFESSV